MTIAITAPTRQTISAGINAIRNDPVLSRTKPPSMGPAITDIPYAVKQTDNLNPRFLSRKGW